MAVATNDSYTAPSGGSIYAGRPFPYAWASGLATDQFVELANTNFSTWAASGIPGSGYLGTDPKASIVNAFCDPGIKDGEAFFNGGGHGDGSCNAVVGFNLRTLQYRLVGAPTPPAKYPPLYVSGFGGGPEATYPSGKPLNGWFLPADQLPDPADTPYGTPLARVSTHMYGAAAMRGNVIYYFYRTYAEFDTSTGLWSGQAVALGPQLYAINPNYNNQYLDQGTMAVYDAVTDRFFVTLVPGDGGGGWRSSIIVFNPTTRLIENIYDSGAYGAISESSALQVIGRKLYIFNKAPASYDQPQVMNQGLIFDLDAKTFKRFSIQGDTTHTTYSPTGGNGVETIPCWYDGSKIHRWNYEPSNKQYVSSLDLTPAGGTGASGDPYLLNQAVRTLSGTPPSALFVYKRMMYLPDAGCVALLPRANSNWFALKLS